MRHWTKDSFLKDVSTLLELIRKYDIPVDPASLYTVENKLSYGSYSIDFKDLVFNVNSKISGTIPLEINKLSIYFDHTCDIDEEKDYSKNDRIKKTYIFRLKIIGFTDGTKEYINFWRLDRDTEGVNPHKTAHPIYHFQSGGDELQGKDTGEIVFLGAPRLSHPPMDLFLGFHFIIHNFYNSKMYEFVGRLMSDDAYREIIDRAQKRFWEPYFNSFNSGNLHLDYTFARTFPLFIN